MFGKKVRRLQSSRSALLMLIAIYTAFVIMFVLITPIELVVMIILAIFIVVVVVVVRSRGVVVVCGSSVSVDSSVVSVSGTISYQCQCYRIRRLTLLSA